MIEHTGWSPAARIVERVARETYDGSVFGFGVRVFEAVRARCGSEISDGTISFVLHALERELYSRPGTTPVNLDEAARVRREWIQRDVIPTV